MTQDETIAVLFDDCMFTLIQRKNYLKKEYGVNYVDELPPSAKGRLITDLRDKKSRIPQDEDELELGDMFDQEDWKDINRSYYGKD